jgi:hypothetical protein
MVQGPCAHLGYKCWDMGIAYACIYIYILAEVGFR